MDGITHRHFFYYVDEKAEGTHHRHHHHHYHSTERTLEGIIINHFHYHHRHAEVSNFLHQSYYSEYQLLHQTERNRQHGENRPDRRSSTSNQYHRPHHDRRPSSIDHHNDRHNTSNDHTHGNDHNHGNDHTHERKSSLLLDHRIPQGHETDRTRESSHLQPHSHQTHLSPLTHLGDVMPKEEAVSSPLQHQHQHGYPHLSAIDETHVEVNHKQPVLSDAHNSLLHGGYALQKHSHDSVGNSNSQIPHFMCPISHHDSFGQNKHLAPVHPDYAATLMQVASSKLVVTHHDKGYDNEDEERMTSSRRREMEDLETELEQDRMEVLKELEKEFVDKLNKLNN